MRLIAKNFIAFFLCLAARTAVSGSSSHDPFLFSSATSPNGIWIAENFGTDGCCGGGFVLIHKISERPAPSEVPIVSPSPEAGIFMIWQDDDHLLLMQASDATRLVGPNEFRGINILYKQYQVRKNDKDTFHDANSRTTVDVKRENALAEIAEGTTKTGKRCAISLSAIDGVIYDKIGMTIEASVNSCKRTKNCAGISSSFWVGQRLDGRHNVALTSATVSDIPSYNRIPHGNGNTFVSGSFGGDSAVDLLKYLDRETLEIEYSLNFFDAVVSYRVETGRIKKSIDAFHACIGDADFNWLAHDRTEPTARIGSDKEH